MIALVVGLAASIDSAVIPNAAAEFGVSEIVEALATGLVSIFPLLSVVVHLSSSGLVPSSATMC